MKHVIQKMRVHLRLQHADLGTLLEQLHFIFVLNGCAQIVHQRIEADAQACDLIVSDDRNAVLQLSQVHMLHCIRKRFDRAAYPGRKKRCNHSHQGKRQNQRGQNGFGYRRCVGAVERFRNRRHEHPVGFLRLHGKRHMCLPVKPYFMLRQTVLKYHHFLGQRPGGQLSGGIEIHSPRTVTNINICLLI